MGLFGRKKKQTNCLAAELDGRLLNDAYRRYMDENGSPREDGLGRGGRINTANGHVILTCDGQEVFINSDINSVTCGELMSHNGAIFSGFNELTGQQDTIIVHYNARFRQ